MPVSQFDHVVDPPPPGGRAPEQRREPSAGLEMQASSRIEVEEVRDGDTPEEPGYGHGV